MKSFMTALTSSQLCRSPRTTRAITEDPRPEKTPPRSNALSGSPAHKKRRIGRADGSTKPTTRESGSRGEGKRETAVVDDHKQSRGPRIITPLASSRWMTQKEQSLYYRMVRDSKGFDVPHFPGVLFFGMVFPVNCDERVDNYTNFAIDTYNSLKGVNLQLVRVVKANRCNTYPMRYYITFEAKDTEGRVRKYQTKVRYVWGKPTGKISVVKFRVNRRSKPSA